MGLSLAQALRLERASSPQVAFVGAGGKTTAIFQLAKELAPCVVTTTTHLGAWQARKADQHIIIRKAKDINQLEEIAFSGVILVTGEEKKNRLASLSNESLAWLKEFCNYHSLPLLVEADGARQKPLKAPAEHEPVIPAFMETVVVMAGLSAVGKPLTDEWVYEAERFERISGSSQRISGSSQRVSGSSQRVSGSSQRVSGSSQRISGSSQRISGSSQRISESSQRISGLSQRISESSQRISESAKQQIITGEMIAKVLAHKNGGLKNIPTKARRIVLLNQADTLEQQAIGGKLAKDLLPKFNSVIISSLKPSNLQTFEPVAAIILAAGSSSRFGQPKQLLNYHGKAFIRAVAETALKAELSPVIVVTGAEDYEIKSALQDLPVQIIHNPDWQEGQSSSIKKAVKTLGKETGSAIFLLADQPQVSPTALRALVEEHAHTLKPVIAPMVEGRRANPVLFDRVTFPALLELQGDVGGRGIFSKFSPSYIQWLDSSLLLDVDRPEDYERLIGLR